MQGMICLVYYSDTQIYEYDESMPATAAVTVDTGWQLMIV